MIVVDDDDDDDDVNNVEDDVKLQLLCHCTVQVCCPTLRTDSHISTPRYLGGWLANFLRQMFISKSSKLQQGITILSISCYRAMLRRRQYTGWLDKIDQT